MYNPFSELSGTVTFSLTLSQKDELSLLLFRSMAKRPNLKCIYTLTKPPMYFCLSGKPIVFNGACSQESMHRIASSVIDITCLAVVHATMTEVEA